MQWQNESISKKQHLVSQNEYKKKLIVENEVVPDPFTIAQKEWLGESDGLTNWPPVYYNDIERFLINLNMSGDLLHRLDCDYKEGKGFRYFATCFVKEVHWYKISDSSPYCFMKCKCTPSQRTSATPHNVWALIQKANPGGKILQGYCSCTAGLLGSCNHVTAMLFRIEAAVSSGVTKPTCTSRLAAWNVPSGSKTVLDMKPICELEFLKHTYRKRANVEETQQNRTIYNAFSPSYESDLKKISSGGIIRQKIYEAFKDCASTSRFVELIECKKKRPKANNNTSVELPNNIITEAELFSIDHAKTNDANVQAFTEKIKLSSDKIRLIYEATKSQSDSEIWFSQRKGRITASKFYHVFTRMNTLNKNKTNEFPTSLVKQHLTDQRFVSIQTKHGIAMEVHAKEKVKTLFKKTHKKVRFYEPGMVVYEKHSFISASPDLEVECECCGKSLVEIKCPYSICESTPTSENLSYLVRVNENTTQLKTNTLYYAQVQGQLAVTATSMAWFFVYTHHGYHIEKIMFDEEYWESILSNLTQFWHQYLAPVILKLRELPLNEKSENTTKSNTSLKRLPSDDSGPSKQLILFNQNKKKSGKIKKVKTKAIPKFYLCGHCKTNCIDNPEKFEDNSIGCTKCKNWYHFLCVNIKTDDEIPPQNAKWLCMKCK